MLVCSHQDGYHRSSPNDARFDLVSFRFLPGWLDIEPEHSLVPLRIGFHVDRGFFPAHLPGKFDGSVSESRREADLLLWLIASAVGLELPYRLLYQIGGEHRCEQYLFAIHLCRNKYQGLFRRYQLDAKLIMAHFLIVRIYTGYPSRWHPCSVISESHGQSRLSQICLNLELTLVYRCRACSTLGFIALVLGAFPFVFYIYGPKLRARSTLIESFD